ncbi:hypothetical protein KAU39_06860 [bacterium]|nr:hypothetical protein [bacterium]
MQKVKIAVFFRLSIALLLLNSMQLVSAQAKSKAKDNQGEHKGWTEGKRKGQKSETPPGWKKGLKKGWENETPPGWNKWNKETREKWQKDLTKAKKKIKTQAKKKEWNLENREKAGIALEFAVRKGVPVRDAENVIQECIGQGLKGEETLRVGKALSEGVGKGENFQTLGTQIKKRIKAGDRGERLTNGIHNMIQTRHRARMEAKEKKTEKLLNKEEFKREKKEEKFEMPGNKGTGGGSGGGGRGRGRK